MTLDFRSTLDLQLSSKSCKITKRHQHRHFRSDRVNRCHAAIDEVIHIWLIRVCPAGLYGPVLSAIYIPSFYPSTSHSSVKSPSLSCSSISVLKSTSSSPSSLSSLIFPPFFLQFPLSSAKLQHQTLQSSVSNCCVFFFFLFKSQNWLKLWG